ncbi:hypothetical protein CHS0354_020633 [Potamilus streckersoni]|uniref:Kinetochore protein Spc24 n=1 Tax=Potamilus streckersoni TaxID=2493646 RepID=A0AAE0T3I6_9BIVA|nr:hypothetical protein CHS0354_020633 [Potamilus streckersoni]
MSYEEVLKHSEELLTVFTNDKLEEELLKKIKTTLTEIHEIRRKQNEKVKQEIQALLEEADKESSQLQQLKDEGKIDRRVEERRKEVEESQQQQQKLVKECEEMSKTLEKSQQDQNRLQEELQRIQINSTQALPEMRYIVNLFSNLTGITWHFDSSEDKLEGFTCSKSDVKPFSLDSTKVSPFFISNYLWDMIEEDW